MAAEWLALNELDRVDWDFEGYDTNLNLNRLHWYPATLVPQLVSVLIQALSRPGDLVLDPMCGSGITVVEAMRLGRKAIGVDSNRLAALITQTKVALLTQMPSDPGAAIEAFRSRLVSESLGGGQ